MASFVLIPGALHGRWTWDRVLPFLEQAGHSAVAPDLPGIGTNTLMAVENVTLRECAEFVAELVRQARSPVILVGHSRGGLVIGEVAESVPELLTGLIYVTALLVPPGETVMDLIRRGRPMENTTRSAPLDCATATALFYNRCTQEDAGWAYAQLCPEPMQMVSTPASVTWERWGRVPRAFIECTEDMIVTPEFQREMQEIAPCDPVISLESDHSPFLCMPGALTKALLDAAEAFAMR